MDKLFVSVLAAAALTAGGAALAQGGGDVDSRPGSTWSGTWIGTGDYPPPVTNSDAERIERAQRGIGPAYGTPEYWGNSGAKLAAPGYVYRGTDRWGRPLFSQVAPAAPYILHDRARRHDRDGDGVPDRRDRYPDDYRRW